MTRPRVPFLPAVLFLALPATATACSVCVTALSWHLFPPVFSWTAIGVGWFTALFLLSRFSGVPLTRVTHSIPEFVSLIVLGLGLGLVFLGPIALLPLLPLAALARVDLRPTPMRARRPALMAILKTPLAVIAFAALAYTGVRDYRIRRAMDSAAVVVYWEGTGLSRNLVNDMIDHGDSGLRELRNVVRGAESNDLQFAAKHLLKHGDLAIDVPIVIGALERVHGESHGWTRDQLALLLRKSTGLNLPDSATGDEWRAAWAARNAELPVATPPTVP